ncbi:hypothetical protein BHE74_00041927 [Ensete ventricosum]|nr:hypothetical protein GW17_00012224 [Ensete ventricosum]RWW51701.1 hypothetical protein BHE74_00041927 [Ensete ventricosum]RZR97167.1 hypothetical protein BHM03_00026286 [Ensete ventricosum]
MLTRLNGSVVRAQVTPVTFSWLSIRRHGSRFGRGRATGEHSPNLLHGVAEVVVDGGDGGEVKLGGGDGGGEHLHADREQASDGGVTIAATAGADVWLAGDGRDDEPGREEGNVGRVLAAHRHLHGVDVYCSVHHDAATGGVGAALLEQEIHAVGGVACSLCEWDYPCT